MLESCIYIPCMKKKNYKVHFHLKKNYNCYNFNICMHKKPTKTASC